MTVREAIAALELEALVSWVMTRLQSDEAWVTIMNNVNVIAVASLSDAACVILSENAEVEESVIRRAEERGINLLRSQLSSFALCARLDGIIHA